MGKKTSQSKEVVKEKLRQRKKESKQKLKEKRARLVIKNLPFTATEENLKAYFQQYGEVVNIELLKKPDGKRIGCGFIQYKLVQIAAKARHHTNGKPFMGRELNVDFAKPKDEYKKGKVKEENKETEAKGDQVKNDGIAMKTEHIKSPKKKPQKNYESDEDDGDSKKSEETEQEDNLPSTDHNPRVLSNDIMEGKTVFIKNVPFQATNDDLWICMSQFGRVYYALICIDKLTEHSKGTAFVKFVNKRDAEKALKAGTELKLMGNILDCYPALGRYEIQKKADEKNARESKDSRNLYLVKEGVILAGTKAAQGVSAGDMAKRLQIEQYKTQMLRNLNMFVSKDRLVVHNLPASWDDNKLRTLFKKYGGPGAVVKEAKIMRDMKNVDAKGVGKSKEYGFVAFTKHENALIALRTLNNNPNIFTSSRRPIISFSIENKKMVTARLKRLEKSKLNNLTNKRIKLPDEKKTVKVREKVKLKPEMPELISSEIQSFSGVTSTPGTIHKMRNRYKLNTQAKLHHQNLKKEKKKLKNMKKSLSEKKREFTKQPKQKINKKAENDNFAKLVNEYKKKIINTIAPLKTKWYE